MDDLVLSDEEASEDYRHNVSSDHSDYATTTVADSINDTKNKSDTNDQQINGALRSICVSEDMERKFEEGHCTDGKQGQSVMQHLILNNHQWKKMKIHCVSGEKIFQKTTMQ